MVGISSHWNTLAGTYYLLFPPLFFSCLAPFYLSTGYGGGCCPIVIASALLYGPGASGTITGTGGSLGNYFSKFFKVYTKSSPKS